MDKISENEYVEDNDENNRKEEVADFNGSEKRNKDITMDKTQHSLLTAEIPTLQCHLKVHS